MALRQDIYLLDNNDKNILNKISSKVDEINRVSYKSCLVKDLAKKIQTIGGDVSAGGSGYQYVRCQRIQVDNFDIYDKQDVTVTVGGDQKKIPQNSITMNYPFADSEAIPSLALFYMRQLPENPQNVSISDKPLYVGALRIMPSSLQQVGNLKMADAWFSFQGVGYAWSSSNNKAIIVPLTNLEVMIPPNKQASDTTDYWGFREVWLGSQIDSVINDATHTNKDGNIIINPVNKLLTFKYAPQYLTQYLKKGQSLNAKYDVFLVY